MVSHSYKFTFIDICKTAGTSISESLLKFNKDDKFESFKMENSFPKSGKHHSISNILGGITCTTITPYIIDNYFKFTFVRNPYDRMISLYEWGQKHNHYDKMTFYDFVINIKENKYNDFNNARYLPMIDWLKDKRDNKIKIDYIGRYENIKDDFNNILNIINIDTNLPHMNKSNRRNINQYYNKELLDIVYNLYEIDFDTFKYKKNFSLIK
jgi:hypothetical protein